MMQEAPFPEELGNLVAGIEYRPGWNFYLRDEDRGQGSKGLTLNIVILAPDTYNPEDNIRVRHLMLVPPAAYDRRSWQHWLFEQILLVERHEACEFFQIDGSRPFAPNHGPGNDPYLVLEIGTLQEKRTSYLGVERDTDAPHGD